MFSVHEKVFVLASCSDIESGCHGVVLLDRMVVMELYHDISPLLMSKLGVHFFLTQMAFVRSETFQEEIQMLFFLVFISNMT